MSCPTPAHAEPAPATIPTLLAPLQALQVYARLPAQPAPLAQANRPTDLRAALAAAVHTFPTQPLAQWAQLYALAAAHPRADSVDAAEALCALGVATIALGEFGAGVALLRQIAALPFAGWAAITHACTEQRRLDDAQVALAQAALCLGGEEAAAQDAAWQRLAARIAHYAWQRSDARAHAERAVALAAGDAVEEAQSALELARLLALYEPEAALQCAVEAEARFTTLGYIIEICHARHAQVLALQWMGRYAASLERCDANCLAYAALAMPHYVAWTENMRCINLWRLDRSDEALAAGRAAHAEFVQRDLPVLIAMAANNVALVHTWRHEYSAAGALYVDVTARCRAANLRFDEARCLANLALVHEALGRYDLALQIHLRSRDLLALDGRETAAPMCDQNIARVLLHLGYPEAAVPHLRLARDSFRAAGNLADAATSTLLLAEVALAQGSADEAHAAALAAQGDLTALGHVREAALALRLAGEAQIALGAQESGIAQIAQAQQTLHAAGFAVDAALCTVALPGAPATALAAAAQLLDDALPELAWRAWLALARARAQEAGADATSRAILDAWLETVRRLAQLRASAPTEQAGAAFFATHEAVYRAAVDAAMRAGDLPAALAVADAALTPAFAPQLALPAALPAAGTTDEEPYLVQLADAEAHARSALEEARTALRTQAAPVQAAAAAPSLAAIRTLVDAHTHAATRLRIARARPAPIYPPQLLDLEALRARGNATHGRRWACLRCEWEPATQTLALFWLDSDRLERFALPLSSLDTALLRHATDPTPAYRQLVYGAALQGQALAPQPYATRLGRTLLPPVLWARLAEVEVLYVAAHGALHNLALAVLSDGGPPLFERTAIVHVPSLTALQRLLERPARTAGGGALVCGVGDFGARAPHLPATYAECRLVAALAADAAPAPQASPVRVLWQADASRAALDAAAHDGTLRGARVLHWATHAIVDGMAPLRSRVLLHGDDELTLPEVVGLGLDADLVTLSACSSALGEPLAGNELISLAYAFLQAGARAVLATLWPVADAAAASFMAVFYDAYWRAPDRGPARALNAAQRAQARAGISPLDWAAYRVIGAA